MTVRESASVPVLFDDPGRCSGCRACLEGCPVGAISMYEDACGFAYPQIDAAACVRCGRCKRVCGFQRGLGREAGPSAFASATREGEINLSASGGVFGALARAMVDAGGVVFGCAYEREGGGLRARHRAARTRGELEEMYGSKYVQSSTNGCYSEVERELRAGRQVLFSGTPCQVAGLRGYLGREYDGLLTVDLVCHGVPSERMLNSYLEGVSGGREVVDARFRSKRDGWDKSLLLEILFADGTRECLSGKESSYYDLFLDLSTLRDSCYECPFAGSLRAGDLTIGDFWGVDKVRPDLLREEGGPFDTRRGVSCLLVNTRSGERWLGTLGGSLVCDSVAFGDVAEYNDQLRHPAKMPKAREGYLSAFEEGGWHAVERIWKPRARCRAILLRIKKLIPARMKRALKEIGKIK